MSNRVQSKRREFKDTMKRKTTMYVCKNARRIQYENTSVLRYTKLKRNFKSGVPLLKSATRCRRGSAGFFARGKPNKPGRTDSFSMKLQHRVDTLFSFFLKCLSSIKTAEPAGQVDGAEDKVTAFCNINELLSFPGRAPTAVF